MKIFYQTILVLILVSICSIYAAAEIRIDQITCACASGGTGSITVIAEGSAGPFTFLWSGPGGYVSTEQNPAELPAPGQYSVTVTNAYGCAVTLEAVVPECPSIQLNRSPNIFHPTSCAASDGVIRWLSGNAVSGGTPPFSFAWNNGATSLSAFNLSQGTHTLTWKQQRIVLWRHPPRYGRPCRHVCLAHRVAAF